jgi:Rieske Fe-S protein
MSSTIDDPSGRRPVLAALGVLGLGALMSAPTLVAALGHVGRGLDGGLEVPIGRADAFPEDSVRRVVVTANQVDTWMLRRGEPIGSVWVARGKGSDAAAYQVLSTVCPHLGCSTVETAHAAEKGYYCPCHDAKYGPDGKRQELDKNPAPRDMDILEHSIVDGVLRIKFARFKPGLAEKVAEA